MENTDAPSVRGQPGQRRASGCGRDSVNAHFFFADEAEIDRKMIAEKNEILEQECQAILAEWRQYYLNQFGEDGLPLANPPIPIEVDTPPNSPLSPVNS